MKRKATLCFLGSGHAAHHLREAAWEKGFEMVPMEQANVVFVSEDTPIAEDGTRDEAPILELCRLAAQTHAVVITSQVEPGFTRKAFGGRMVGVYHQVELLRARDAGERARHPEMLIVGIHQFKKLLHWSAHASPHYAEYLRAFDCPVLMMQWEEAEFAKIAVNMALATQVDYANRMDAACRKLGIDWETVSAAVHLDSRIGPRAYLEPGDWRKSRHLLRDSVTLQKIVSGE